MIATAMIIAMLALFFFSLLFAAADVVAHVCKCLTARKYTCRRCKQEIAAKEIEEDYHQNPLGSMRE